MGYKKLVAVFLFVLSPYFAFAEDAPTPTGFSVLNVTVKQGGGFTFQQVAAKFQAANEKLNTSSVFATSPGIGENRLYTFASPFFSFTELAEQRNVLVEAYGEEEAQKLFGMLQESVESVDSFIAIPRPDLGIQQPEMDSQPEITLSISITAKEGRTADFEDYMGKLIEASRATAPDLYWNTYQIGLGGPTNSYGVRKNMNWADLDTPAKPAPQRLIEHFGKRNGERIFAEGQDAIKSSESAVRRIRSDLGHMQSE